MTQTPSRDWKKDMDTANKIRSGGNGKYAPAGWLDALEYWLQEAKERGRRERILKESLEHCIKEYPLYDSKEIGGSLMMDFMKNTLSILYPDTPAEPVDIGTEKWDIARPIEDWHEDIGPVLWWIFPIEEPPYCGSPLDVDWPGYHTHWAPFIIPFTPAPKEEN